MGMSSSFVTRAVRSISSISASRPSQTLEQRDLAELAAVETVAVWSETADGDREHLLCNNLATLLWLGQLADLELHVSLAGQQQLQLFHVRQQDAGLAAGCAHHLARADLLARVDGFAALLAANLGQAGLVVRA